jgi:hypothetical protein
MAMYKSSAGSKNNTDPLIVLSDIWIQIVKPVLDHLQLEVLIDVCCVETVTHSSFVAVKRS